MKTWLAGQNAEKPRQSKNKCSSAWKGFEGGRRSGFTHAFRPFSHGQSRLHLGTPRGKTSTASRCLAPVRSQIARRRLPSFQVADRQDGADGCAVSDTGPVELETAADQVETDPAVESQGRSRAQLQRSASFPWLGKEANRKRTGE